MRQGLRNQGGLSDRLTADTGYMDVAKLREGVFSDFKAGWFAASEDTRVTFRSDKFYEMGGASLFPREAERASLGRYFEVSGPIKLAYGGVPPRVPRDAEPDWPEVRIQLHP